MGRSKAVTWIAGTVVLALTLVAGAWVFLISGMLAEAAEMKDQAESERLRAEQLEITLAGLARDFENIEEFRDELAGLQAQVPETIEISEVVRRLDAMAATAGVVIVSAATTTAVNIEPAAPPPADAETSDESTEEAVGDSATAPAVAAPDREVLYAVPVDLVTIGGYDPTLEFVRLLQANERLILVSDLQLSAQEPAAAEGGLPARVDGDVEARISTWVFVLLGPGGSVEVVEPPDGEELPEEVLPVPSGQKNPFVPQV